MKTFLMFKKDKFQGKSKTRLITELNNFKKSGDKGQISIRVIYLFQTSLVLSSRIKITKAPIINFQIFKKGEVTSEG